MPRYLLLQCKRFHTEKSEFGHFNFCFLYSFGDKPFNLEKNLLKDGEEDLFWSQGVVELIEKIDAKHWLRMQL